MTNLADLPANSAANLTVRASLRPIDRDGLMKFADTGRGNPARRGTNRVHTVMEGQYRSFSYVADHHPVVVDEPLALFGQNTAPAPGWLEDRRQPVTIDVGVIGSVAVRFAPA